MSRGGLKSNAIENYIECKCSIRQLKDRNQDRKKAKANYYNLQKNIPLKQIYRRVKKED